MTTLPLRTLARILPLATLAAALSLAACGNSGGGTGGGTTGTGGNGAGGSGGGTTGTGGTGGGGACTVSLATACQNVEQPGEFGVSCAMTWDAALADKHYCGTTITESTADCGAYNARIALNVDFSYTYYYDKSSGALVAVYDDSVNDSIDCVGGPPGFALPTCTAAQPLMHCP